MRKHEEDSMSRKEYYSTPPSVNNPWSADQWDRMGLHPEFFENNDSDDIRGDEVRIAVWLEDQAAKKIDKDSPVRKAYTKALLIETLLILLCIIVFWKRSFLLVILSIVMFFVLKKKIFKFYKNIENKQNKKH